MIRVALPEALIANTRRLYMQVSLIYGAAVVLILFSRDDLHPSFSSCRL